MDVNSGTIENDKDRHGNPIYRATSHLEPKTVEFYSMNGAIFWLGLIEERVKATAQRIGARRA